MEFLPLPVTMMMCSMPEATHSSTTYWICGLSTTVSISLGCALVAGKKRVPSPAAGRTALRTLGWLAEFSGDFVESVVMFAKVVSFVQKLGLLQHSSRDTGVLSMKPAVCAHPGEKVRELGNPYLGRGPQTGLACRRTPTHLPRIQPLFSGCFSQ